jgi:hypothetical protein
VIQLGEERMKRAKKQEMRSERRRYRECIFDISSKIIDDEYINEINNDKQYGNLKNE